MVRGLACNTGDRDGTDVVQVYAALPDADAPDRLVGFARVEVLAGASASFEVVVPRQRLETRNSARKSWTPATGDHVISTGRFAGDPDSVVTTVTL